MNIDKIISASGGDPERTETLSFRLVESDKRELLLLCEERGLSLGRLMRAIVREFLDEV